MTGPPPQEAEDLLEFWRKDTEQQSGTPLDDGPGMYVMPDEGEPDPRRDSYHDLPSRQQMALDAAAGAREVISGNVIHGIDWPWSSAQKIWGPIVSGRLMIVGARPNNGKSTLMLNLCDALLANNVPALYLGTEMPPDLLMVKWALARLGFDEEWLAFNKWAQMTGDNREALELEIGQLTRGSVIFPPCLSLDRTSLTRWIDWAFEMIEGQERQPKVVILDHLHRVQPDQGEDEHSAINRAILALSNIAKERNVGMLVNSQLSRPERSGRAKLFDLYTPPGMSDFRGSGAIEQEADRKSTRLNSSHTDISRMPSSA